MAVLKCLYCAIGRSSLAQGLQQNDNIGLAPPATNMEKMVRRVVVPEILFRNGLPHRPDASTVQEYVCDVESSAMRSAQSCSGGISQESTRPGLKENTFRATDMSLDLRNVAETAMTTWWSQLSRNGVDEPNMQFTTELRFRTNSIISFSKMAWHNNVRLGCAIQRCPNFYFVVCQYGPGGNNIGENIYDVGSTCTRCPAGTTCEPTDQCVTREHTNGRSLRPPHRESYWLMKPIGGGANQ
ncbi:SCP-like protein [Teladorsagia circumcincta]|uniref:SCP-like protein n=1 Tax=Teladorsagia circumcincta TaxID=45464 RepID=A0A2G9U4Q0_TELCI|nr:SCP-like protein [Teladorsagia circumcincta]